MVAPHTPQATATHEFKTANSIRTHSHRLSGARELLLTLSYLRGRECHPLARHATTRPQPGHNQARGHDPPEHGADTIEGAPVPWALPACATITPCCSDSRAVEELQVGRRALERLLDGRPVILAEIVVPKAVSAGRGVINGGHIQCRQRR